MRPDPEPILNDALFQDLQSARGILLAVSGGSDSVALLVLAARWHQKYPHILFRCATVDHGLRPEAQGDADYVGQLCAGYGIEHTRLVWDGEKPVSGIEKAAREARYRLLCGHARSHGLTHLLTAHILEDQAETVLMRLAAGSGLSGLSGMRGRFERAGIIHCRPFLGVPKDTLIAFLQQEGIVWRHDSMNDDLQFSRVRLRASRSILEKEGLSATRLAVLAKRMARAEQALELQAQEAFSKLIEKTPEGYVCKAAAFFELADEIALRLLLRVAQSFHDDDLYMRLGKFEALLDALKAAFAQKKTCIRTLAGLKFALVEKRSGSVLRITSAPERRLRPIITLS